MDYTPSRPPTAPPPARLSAESPFQTPLRPPLLASAHLASDSPVWTPATDSTDASAGSLDILAVAGEMRIKEERSAAGLADRSFASSGRSARFQNGYIKDAKVVSAFQTPRFHQQILSKIMGSPEAVMASGPSEAPVTLPPLPATTWEELLQAHGVATRCFQPRTCDALLAGRDAVVLARTGLGKSLLWTLPFWRVPEALVVLVVPLLSVGEAQAARARALGLCADFYHGENPSDDDLRHLLCTPPQLLVATYEFLGCARFSMLLRTPSFANRIRFLAYDEAHYIIEAASYRSVVVEMGRIREVLRRRVPVLLTTATATPAMVDQLAEAFGISLNDPVSCFRLNLGTRRREIRSWIGEMRDSLAGPFFRDLDFLLPSTAASPLDIPSTLIYTDDLERLRALVFRIQDRLRALSLSPALVSSVLAPLELATRNERYEAFEKGTVRILVATEVYGAGGNPPSVRRVVQWGVGRISAVQLMQRKGRAGRDGQEAEFYVFVEPGMRPAEQVGKRGKTTSTLAAAGYDAGAWALVAREEGECLTVLEDAIFAAPPADGFLDSALCSCGRCYLFALVPCTSACCDPSFSPPLDPIKQTRTTYPGQARALSEDEKGIFREELRRWRMEMWTAVWRSMDEWAGPEEWLSLRDIDSLAEHARASLSTCSREPSDALTSLSRDCASGLAALLS
ncbi:hypothetical protein JCM5296_006444 [Sporobolomyces johnsonii]